MHSKPVTIHTYLLEYIFRPGHTANPVYTEAMTSNEGAPTHMELSTETPIESNTYS